MMKLSPLALASDIDPKLQTKSTTEQSITMTYSYISLSLSIHKHIGNDEYSRKVYRYRKVGYTLTRLEAVFC